MSQIVQSQPGHLIMPAHGVIAAGRYHGTLIRAGRVIDEWEDDNLVVNQGLNSMLGVYFNGATQIATWYCGIFEGNYTPVATVTAATITSASTECTAYVSATRPEWVEAAPSSQSITNSASRAAFVFNATKTVYGAFLISSSTKSGTGGTLFSAARFSSAKNVVTDDELLLTYTFTAASA
jgi:hypothetical protein